MIITWIIFILVLSVNLLFLRLIAYKGKKNQVRLSFSWLTVLVILWITANFFSDFVKNDYYSLILARLTYTVTAIIPLIILYFSTVFPKQVGTTSTKWKIAISTPTLLVVILSFTNLIVAEIERYDLGINIKSGPLLAVFGIYFLGYMITAFVILWKKYKNLVGLEKAQVQYLFLGTLTGTIGGAAFNLIIPAITNDYSYSRFGPYFSILLVGFTSYAIIKHRLFETKVIITRSLLYLVLLTIVTTSLVFITVLSGLIFGETQSGQVIVSIIIASLIVFGLDPLKRGLSQITDSVFFQAKVDYAKLLQKLSSIISLELDLQKLIDDLEKGLVQGIKVKKSFILLREQTSGKTKRFRATIEHDLGKDEVVIENDSPLIRYVREHRHLSLLESLERKIEDTPEGPAKKKEEGSKAEFEKLGVALVAPIFSEDHLVAVMTLGPKLSGDSFSNDDVQLIEVLAPQIGSAIEKAKLYDEVRQFSESLKIKVNEATKELRDRNVSLQTLQNITRDITRTLDFSKVVQNIANAVSTELGFLGAILVFLDDDGKTLRSRAVTSTPLTDKAIKLLPKKFNEYTSDITDSKKGNLAHDVIRTGEIRFTESMTDVISPPIPKPLVAAMQKLIGINTMILVPIVSEQKVIGVIEVGAKRKREEISQREIETIQSMADELGVVARNITLFDQISRTNAQLEVANKHLRQLDQAKSEFVSIASHQLRTPMTGIMGYLSMMTQGDFGKIAPEHNEILVKLLSESQRMIRLINQFLNVSKIEAGKLSYQKAPIKIAELIAKEVDDVQKSATDKKLKIAVTLPKKPLPIIMADPDRLQEVILNLVDNAVKYTNKGTITIGAEIQNDMMHVWVQDSGIGIKPQDATELFNKFVRGTGIAQIHPDGSGLGLFIAKSVIDAHGGKIWAESAGEGKGSTFQFTLPLNPVVEAPKLGEKNSSGK